jgi:hypothetical protein
VLLPGIVWATSLGILASRMRPPAVDVALRCLTIVAILLFARLVAWVGQSGHRFAREERLLAFVMFSTIALAWLGLRQEVTGAAFDYQVAAQRAQLAMAARTLSYQIDAFLDARRRIAPPPPRPLTWEQDVGTLGRFETETIEQYESRFGAQVRAAHDLLTLRGMRNRDLDAFYRLPANEFQMRVVADKLAFLAAKLDQGTLSSF